MGPGSVAYVTVVVLTVAFQWLYNVSQKELTPTFRGS